MEKPIIIVVDFTKCTSSFEIHLVIQKSFDFPNWYGKNWDAFWDLFYPTRNNTLVEIHGVSSMHERTKQHMEKFLSLLQKNKDKMLELKQRKPEFDCRFDYKVIN